MNKSKEKFPVGGLIFIKPISLLLKQGYYFDKGDLANDKTDELYFKKELKWFGKIYKIIRREKGADHKLYCIDLVAKNGRDFNGASSNILIDLTNNPISIKYLKTLYG